MSKKAPNLTTDQCLVIAVSGLVNDLFDPEDLIIRITGYGFDVIEKSKHNILKPVTKNDDPDSTSPILCFWYNSDLSYIQIFKNANFLYNDRLAIDTFIEIVNP